MQSVPSSQFHLVAFQMEFDRFVALVHGSLSCHSDSLSKQGKIDRLEKAHLRCVRIASSKDSTVHKASIPERKLFLFLILNASDMDLPWRSEKKFRHLSMDANDFCLTLDIVCEMIHRRGWISYLVEILPLLPTQNGLALAQAWIHYEARVDGTKNGEFIQSFRTGVLASLFAVASMSTGSQPNPDLDELISAYLNAFWTSVEGKGRKSHHLALALLLMKQSNLGSPLHHLIQCARGDDITQLYSQWNELELLPLKEEHFPKTLDALRERVCTLVHGQTVSDWLDFVDDPTDALINNPYISFWSGPDGPTNMQALIAHYAHTIVESGCDKVVTLDPAMASALGSMARRFDKEAEFRVADWSIDQMMEHYPSAVPWQRTLILQEMASNHRQRAEVQALLAAHASCLVEHLPSFFGDFMDGSQTDMTVCKQIAWESPVESLLDLFHVRLDQYGLAFCLRSSAFEIDLKRLLNTMTKRDDEQDFRFDQKLLLVLAWQDPQTVIRALWEDGISGGPQRGANLILVQMLSLLRKALLAQSTSQIFILDLVDSIQSPPIEGENPEDRIAHLVSFACLVSDAVTEIRGPICSWALTQMLQGGREELKTISHLCEPGSLAGLDPSLVLTALRCLCHVLLQNYGEKSSWTEGIIRILHGHFHHEERARTLITESLPKFIVQTHLTRTKELPREKEDPGEKMDQVMKLAIDMTKLYPSQWSERALTFGRRAFCDAFQVFYKHRHQDESESTRNGGGGGPLSCFSRALGELLHDQSQAAMEFFADVCHLLADETLIQPPGEQDVFLPLFTQILLKLDQSGVLDSQETIQALLPTLATVPDFRDKNLLLDKMNQFDPESSEI